MNPLLNFIHCGHTLWANPISSPINLPGWVVMAPILVCPAKSFARAGPAQISLLLQLLTPPWWKKCRTKKNMAAEQFLRSRVTSKINNGESICTFTLWKIWVCIWKKNSELKELGAARKHGFVSPAPKQAFQEKYGIEITFERLGNFDLFLNDFPTKK